MRPFRCSFNLRGLRSRAALVERLRGAEAAGYDTVFVPDHLGSNAPFAVCAAAGGLTSMRVGTLVVNAPFWNPALLAREAATVDVLTGGRLELGLGSGHMKWEFDAADIPFLSFGARADQLEHAITELGRFFGSRFPQVPEEVPSPEPVQRVGFGGTGPPLIVGGTGDRVLEIAARHADIVGVAGTFQARGRPPGTLRLATAEQAAERVAFAREHAGERAEAVEWHLLIQYVEVTADRRAAAETLVARWGDDVGMDAEQVLETPYVLIGTEEQIAEQLLAHRARYGFSYLTVHEQYTDVFAPVVERLRNVDGT